MGELVYTTQRSASNYQPCRVSLLDYASNATPEQPPDWQHDDDDWNNPSAWSLPSYCLHPNSMLQTFNLICSTTCWKAVVYKAAQRLGDVLFTEG